MYTPNKAANVPRRKRAYDLRQTGLTYKTIGESMGVSATQARNLCILYEVQLSYNSKDDYIRTKRAKLCVRCHHYAGGGKETYGTCHWLTSIPNPPQWLATSSFRPRKVHPYYGKNCAAYTPEV